MIQVVNDSEAMRCKKVLGMLGFEMVDRALKMMHEEKFCQDTAHCFLLCKRNYPQWICSRRSNDECRLLLGCLKPFMVRDCTGLAWIPESMVFLQKNAPGRSKIFRLKNISWHLDIFLTRLTCLRATSGLPKLKMTVKEKRFDTISLPRILRPYGTTENVKGWVSEF